MNNLTPLKAIRAYCLWCCGDNAQEVRLCPSTKCSLYPARLGRDVAGLRLLKLIRARCRDCVETLEQVKHFKADKVEMSCSLYPYRMGKNPKRKGKGGNLANLSRKTTTRNAI